MHCWRYSDSTIVEFDGAAVRVIGHSTFARGLRAALSDVATGLTVLVGVAAEPGGSVGLDPRSPWLVDAWLRQEAERPSNRVGVALVRSDYVPTAKDIPPHARELLESREGDGDGDGLDDDGLPIVN
jgi:hypothetical protein